MMRPFPNRPSYAQRDWQGARASAKSGEPGPDEVGVSGLCWSAAFTDAVRGFRPHRLEIWRAARTYSGQRHRQMSYIEVFPQLRGVFRCQSVNTVKPSAQPTLVRTQHLPHKIPGQTRCRRIASPGFRVRTSGYENRRLRLWAIRGPDPGLMGSETACRRCGLTCINTEPGTWKVHARSVIGTWRRGPGEGQGLESRTYSGQIRAGTGGAAHRSLGARGGLGGDRGRPGRQKCGALPRCRRGVPLQEQPRLAAGLVVAGSMGGRPRVHGRYMPGRRARLPGGGCWHCCGVLRAALRAVQSPGSSLPDAGDVHDGDCEAGRGRRLGPGARAVALPTGAPVTAQLSRNKTAEYSPWRWASQYGICTQMFNFCVRLRGMSIQKSWARRRYGCIGRSSAP